VSRDGRGQEQKQKQNAMERLKEKMSGETTCCHDQTLQSSPSPSPHHYRNRTHLYRSRPEPSTESSSKEFAVAVAAYAYKPFPIQYDTTESLLLIFYYPLFEERE
jgi:hypothetical protein